MCKPSLASCLGDGSSLFLLLLTSMQVGCSWLQTKRWLDWWAGAPSSGWSWPPNLPSLGVCAAGGTDAAHTERRGLCGCRLMLWLIDLQPLYSFTTRFEIQHCTWGAVCVPSLSPFINLFLDLLFSTIQTFLWCWVRVSANSPRRDMPQVGISASAASGCPLPL